MPKRFNSKIRFSILLAMCLVTSCWSQDTGTDEPPANPYCVKGCIRCDPISLICEICDSSSGYVPTLNKKGCELTSEEHCVYMGIDGKCVVCKQNYYVNSSDGSCVEVSNEEKVENCFEYDSNTNCTECNSGFYLTPEKKCETISQGIENCSQPKASDSTLCERCKVGKLLSTDGKSCLNPPAGECSTYKNAQCIECNSGYVLNPNSYQLNISNYLTSSKGRATMSQMLRSLAMSDLTYLDNEMCTNPTVSNCEKFVKFNECEVCKEGFFLDNKKDCVENPEDQIQHCVLYKTNLECLLCKDHYYFVANDPSVCEEGNVVKNCQVYSVNEDSCAACLADFYLDGNVCKDRVASKNMVTCLTFNMQKDECSVCKETFALTLAGCQPGIENCGEYEDVATSREELVCSKCNDGFYYKVDEKKCVQPETFAEDFCQEYKFNEAVCSTCKDRYFFDTQITKCKIHDNIDTNCAKSSLTSRNSCQECNQGFKAYSVQKLCKLVAVPINNCLEYDTENICKQCALNYFGDTCQEISISRNCQRVVASSTSDCELCKTGYFTNEVPFSKQCVAPFEAQADQCESFELNNNEAEISCTQCKENSYPVMFNTNKVYVCEPKSNYSGVSLPDNCEMINYDSSGPTYTCMLCSSGYVLDGGNCVSQCSNGKVQRKLSLGQFSSATEVKIASQNDCHSPDSDFPNCKYIVPRVDTTVASMTYLCGECKSSFSNVVDIKSVSARLKVHNYSPEDGQFKMGLRNPGLFCETVGNSALSGTSSTTNCALFGKFTVSGVPKYGCIKCNMGKTGKIIKAHATVDYFVIEACDIDIAGCVSSETDMRGITPFNLITANTIFTSYENYLSCIQCQGSSSSIPFLSFVMDTNKMVLKNYKDASLLAGNLTAKAGIETDAIFVGNSMACRDYTVPTDFGLPEETSMSFIANCAIGAFEVDQLTLAAAIYCIACKKEYDPVMTGRVITNCDPIPKCTSSNRYNFCSNCETPFNDNTWRCNTEVFSDPNCLRVKAGECVVCKNQYSVNADGICEKIAVYKCKTGKMELPGGFLTEDIDFVISEADRLGIADKTWGCSECESNYVAIKGLAISNVCVQSDYLKINSIPTPSAFIRNCLKYGYNFSTSKTICKVCKAGLMPNGSANECLSSLPGCLQSQVGNDSACQTCDSGRTLIGNNCTANSIANCLEFSTDGAQLFCEKCSPGYYILDKTQCIEGKVPNCNIYTNNSEEECVECNDRYVIYRNVEGKTFCLSYQNFNCTEWTNSSSFSCTTCTVGYFPAIKLETDPSHFCVGGNFAIDNCAELNTSLLCTHCNSGYYLNSAKTNCVTRAKKVDKCKDYSVNADTCETCEANYYLHSNGNCYKYPIGIQFCLVYQNISTCLQCDPNKYLSDGICLNVTQFVDFCELYSAEGECVSCVDTHLLIDATTCVKIQALKCASIKSHLECLTCADGYGLALNSGVTSCVDASLANCQKNTIVKPYTCTFCDAGFYLSEGDCNRASPEIESCRYYTDNLHCSECKEFFVLSEDKTQCLSNYVVAPQVDFNCKIYHEKQFSCASCPANKNFVLEEATTPARLLSSPARFLQTEIYDIFKYQCKECGGIGCMICDSFDFTACYICLSGYHMNVEGKCVDDTPEDEDDGGDSSSQHKLSFVLMVVLTLLWAKIN